MKRIIPLSLLAWAFWPLTVLVLFADSRVADLQPLSDVLAPAFLLLLLSRMRPGPRLQVALFVPISAAGEGVFSLIFGLYHYRLGGVPFYVPFGHAILLAVGLILADTGFVKQNERRVRDALIFFHVGLMGGAFLVLGDSLSALFGLMFFLVLRRKRGRPFYLIMGVLVLYIELLGTWGGAWVWDPAPWGLLHTTNPPTGAFACYVIGDILAMKAAGRIAPWLARLLASGRLRRNLALLRVPVHLHALRAEGVPHGGGRDPGSPVEESRG